MNPSESGYKSITGLTDDHAVTPPPASVQLPPTLQQQAALQAGGVVKCSMCGAVIVDKAYQVNSGPACAGCAVAAGVAVDTSAAYSKALIYGIGAAIGGLMFYAGFTIAFHFYIGYVALAVGWLVAKAMMAGSQGIGGPKYQITAAVLTYFAISLAAIPILIAEVYESGQSDVNWATLVPKLLVYGIASPLIRMKVSPMSGIIRLVILFVGIRIAWSLTAARKIRAVKPAGSF